MAFQFSIQNVNVVGGAGPMLICAPATYRDILNIWNTDAANTIYVGGPGVTLANGHAIPPGQCHQWAGLEAIFAVFGMCESGTIHVICHQRCLSNV